MTDAGGPPGHAGHPRDGADRPGGPAGGAVEHGARTPVAEPLTADLAWQRLLGVRAVGDGEQAGLRQEGGGRWEWTGPCTPEAAALADLYAPLCLAGPAAVFGQLGQSLDGFIAARTGDACFVTGPEDRAHLHRLRALADAVLVGASTAVADDPQLTVRAVAGQHPVRVVVDASGRVPPDRRLFTDGAAPTLWLVANAADPAPPSPGVEVIRLAADAARGFSARQILDLLAARGLRRVLVEGGGATVSRFLREQALHRLYVTVAPVLIGDGVPGLRFPGQSAMRDALRPRARRFPLGADVLFELDLVQHRE